MLAIDGLKRDRDLLGLQVLSNQPAQDGKPASSLAGEDGAQDLGLLLGSLLVQIDAQRPATLKGIAGNPKVQHKAQTIQPGVPGLSFLDAETQDRLTGDLGRVAPKVAGTCGGAITRFQYVPPHAPRSLRCHDTPPFALC